MPGDPALVARLVRTFTLARADYVAAHKSRHWDIFPPDYATQLADPANWDDFRCNGLTSGCDLGQWRASRTGPNLITDPAVARPFLRRHESLRREIGDEFIRTYHEAEIGNPPRVLHDGLMLNGTDQRLLHDAWRLREQIAAVGTAPLLAVEIGGGFGGLMAKLKRLFPQTRLALFDLPEVNAVQTYYLTRAVPGVRLLTYDEFKEKGLEPWLTGACEIAVLPGWCIASLPDRAIDLFVNTRSMMEMTRATVGFYFEQIQRAARPGSLFYCVNRYVKTTVGEAVRIKDYPFDARWTFLVSRTAWDQPQMHELVAVRQELPQAYPARQVLAALPPRSWSEVPDLLGRLARTALVLTWGGDPMVNPGLRDGLKAAGRKVVAGGFQLLHRLPWLYRILRAGYRLARRRPEPTV